MPRSFASSGASEAHRSRKTGAAIPAASSVSVIRVDPTRPPAHQCAWRLSPKRVPTRRDRERSERTSCDGFPARGSRARTASAGAARARQLRVDWPCDRSLRSPGQPFAPAQLPRAGKTRLPQRRSRPALGPQPSAAITLQARFTGSASRPLTLACANRCPGSRADLDHISKDDALPSRAVPVLGGRARLERATCRGASLRLVPAKRTEAGKPARRFPRRVRSLSSA